MAKECKYNAKSSEEAFDGYENLCFPERRMLEIGVCIRRQNEEAKVVTSLSVYDPMRNSFVFHLQYCDDSWAVPS